MLKGIQVKYWVLLLKEISPEEQERMDNRMLLATKIDEGRKAKGWSQSEFAEKMEKHPSEISKWLSGTHNFTADTLWDIEKKLEIELISINKKELKVTKLVEYRIVVSSPVPLRYAGLNRSVLSKPFKNKLIFA